MEIKIKQTIQDNKQITNYEIIIYENNISLILKQYISEKCSKINIVHIEYDFKWMHALHVFGYDDLRVYSVFVWVCVYSDWSKIFWNYCLTRLTQIRAILRVLFRNFTSYSQTITLKYIIWNKTKQGATKLKLTLPNDSLA